MTIFDLNTFIESKKLSLSVKKSNRLHVAKKKNESKDCSKLHVHGEVMGDIEKTKYLGDIVDTSGKIEETVSERVSKGYGMIAQIISILEEIPLGKHKTEVGLILRNAMLHGCMLFNSEVWHGLLQRHIRALEVVDEYLLRSIMKAHQKTPIEFIYLETGALPIRHIISSRRLLIII